MIHTFKKFQFWVCLILIQWHAVWIVLSANSVQQVHVYTADICVYRTKEGGATAWKAEDL